MPYKCKKSACSHADFRKEKRKKKKEKNHCKDPGRSVTSIGYPQNMKKKSVFLLSIYEVAKNAVFLGKR